MIKSQVLSLLTRLIRKWRYILKNDIETNHKSSDPPTQITRDAHFEQIFITWGFIKTILEDISAIKKEEEKSMAANVSKEK